MTTPTPPVAEEKFINIPKEIKICGRIYKVQIEDLRTMGSDWGKCRPVGSIALSEEIKNQDHVERIFIEEVLHAIFYEIGQNELNEKEDLIQSLSTVLYAVLKENQINFNYD